MSTQAPHRGVTILVLGIIGLLLCQFLGIPAWIMGKGDLERIDRGEMDPEGRSLTQVGMILGMISVGLLIISLLVGILMVVGVLGTAAVSAQ